MLPPPSWDAVNADWQGPTSPREPAEVGIMSVFRYLETRCLAAAYRGGPDPDPERTVRGADPWAQAEATQALDLRLRGCP